MSYFFRQQKTNFLKHLVMLYYIWNLILHPIYAITNEWY